MVPDNSHIDCVKQEGIGHGPIIYNIYAESRNAKLSFQFKFNSEPPVKIGDEIMYMLPQQIHSQKKL